MSIDPTTEFELNGIHCFRHVDEANTFYVLPTQPSPELTPAGAPTLQMMTLGEGGWLQLGVRWQLSDAEQTQLREALATQENVNPSHIRLLLAPLTIEKVTLWLGDGCDEQTVLQINEQVATPPYTAIFNVMLTAEQVEPVSAALNGRSNFLTVTYTASLLLSRTAAVTLVGDMRDDLAALNGTAIDPDLLLTRVEMGIENGRLTLTRSQAAGIAESVWLEAEAQAKGKAAELLQQFLSGAAGAVDSAELNLSVSLHTPEQRQIDQSSDVATWFKTSKGTNHIGIGL